jgi:simple sugar transport system ATP-binding protein
MVGRDVLFRLKKEPTTLGKKVLEIRDLQARNDMGQMALEQVNLELHEGEILGIAGVAGNGQKELMESLIGVRKVEGGSILIDGQDTKGLSPREIFELGVGHIPSDRIKQGSISSFTVAENLILGNEWKTSSGLGILLNESYINELAVEGIKNFDINTPSPDHQVKYLSGGNLQKVILAREFATCPVMLLADQPCRGLDVGVIEYVHSQLLKLRSEGIGILLISEDLDEIFDITDRIAVIFKGRILSVLPTETANRKQIGLLMAGGSEDLA